MISKPPSTKPKKIPSPLVNDDGSYRYARGKRKTGVATVKVFSGKGEILVNGKPYQSYFQKSLHDVVTGPLKVLGLDSSRRVEARVTGGGIRGQAESVRLGIARALVVENPDWKTTLRSNGFMTRDPRAKERKKYGLKRARRAPQWTKR